MSVYVHMLYYSIIEIYDVIILTLTHVCLLRRPWLSAQNFCAFGAMARVGFYFSF